MNVFRPNWPTCRLSLNRDCGIRKPIRRTGQGCAIWSGILCFLASAPALHAQSNEGVDFNRQVRPILAQHCFACHGPDDEHREADLRLDRREVAVGSGAIVPHDLAGSELIQRVKSTDSDLRMPPAEQPALTAEQIEVLERWIQTGADYQEHWAFVPPVAPEPPRVEWNDWPRNEIDHFVLKQLERQELSPEPEADVYTLIRRLYLDLIGLPPTPEEADDWAKRLRHTDQATERQAAQSASATPRINENAYQKLVGSLLASPRYGERWARPWLDLARYSDTNGYEKDRPRSIWPYRDWVIRALNADMPFDQFSIEQLAGDMLPSATQDQRIATGFHRNTMLNEEGGIDPLEYRYYAMVDRVATTGLVWMGLTTGCAQCHSHKYDPISHTDFYQLMALMNQADEPDLSVSTPELETRRKETQTRIEALEQQLTQRYFESASDVQDHAATKDLEPVQEAFAQWWQEQQPLAVKWHPTRPVRATSNLPRLTILEDDSVLAQGDITKRDQYRIEFELPAGGEPIQGIRLEVLPDERLPAGGPGMAYYEGRKGDFFLSEVFVTRDSETIEMSGASHSFGKISIGSGSAQATNVLDRDASTGWSTAGREGQPNQLVLNLSKPVEAEGKWVIEMLFERHFAASLGRFRISFTSRPQPQASTLPVEIESILTSGPDTWNAEQWRHLQRYFVRTSPLLAEARKPLDALQKQLPQPPQTMVLQERPVDYQRVTHRHHRGEYLSPREEVTAQLPAYFASRSERQPGNRLEFARWLVSRENPLVGRVTVNRAWREFFGRGLIETSGDLGTQSNPPTHPELLDWLAVRFMQDNASLKSLHRLIVSSATYRQRAEASNEKRQRDPANQWYARGPRFRLPAETVRDSLLKATGLLSDKMYGPSVFPPQPASVTALAYGNFRWTVSQGEDRYRRSLYTFSKRTAPFAAYLVFDGPSGETCLARRDRSNTPLQALTLLNDPMFLEMARSLAAQSLQRVPKLAEPSVADDPGSKVEERRLRWMFRRLLTRPPTSEESDSLRRFFARQLARLEAGELSAQELLGEGAVENDAIPTHQRAAWVLVARAIMNVDEAITKP